MKKVYLIFISSIVFATPLIDAARNQDYKTFERLVNEGCSLDEKNELGMNVQLALVRARRFQPHLSPVEIARI